MSQTARCSNHFGPERGSEWFHTTRLHDPPYRIDEADIPKNLKRSRPSKEEYDTDPYTVSELQVCMGIGIILFFAWTRFVYILIDSSASLSTLESLSKSSLHSQHRYQFNPALRDNHLPYQNEVQH